MTREIPVTQARADLAELVNRVGYSGERILLTRHGRPLAALVPVSDLEALEQPPAEIGFMLRPAPEQPAEGAQPSESAPRHGGPGRIAAEHRDRSDPPRRY